MGDGERERRGGVLKGKKKVVGKVVKLSKGKREMWKRKAMRGKSLVLENDRGGNWIHMRNGIFSPVGKGGKNEIPRSVSLFVKSRCHYSVLLGW